MCALHVFVIAAIPVPFLRVDQEGGKNIDLAACHNDEHADPDCAEEPVAALRRWSSIRRRNVVIFPHCAEAAGFADLSIIFAGSLFFKRSLFC